jgi:hypothetical protein
MRLVRASASSSKPVSHQSVGLSVGLSRGGCGITATAWAGVYVCMYVRMYVCITTSTLPNRPVRRLTPPRINDPSRPNPPID